MANLFNKAKQTGPVSKAKKEKTEIVVNDRTFHGSLVRLSEVNRQLNDLKAEAALLSGEVKERAITEFVKLYNDGKKFPGSFNITGTGAKGKEDATFLFIPTDRYIVMDEERYTEIVEKYGTGVAVEKTTYEMNADLIEKYGDIISDLIENCKKIDEADKAALISAKTAYNIKSGIIEDLPGILEDVKKAKKTDYKLSEIVEDIRPVYQIKNVKIK